MGAPGCSTVVAQGSHMVQGGKLVGILGPAKWSQSGGGGSKFMGFALATNTLQARGVEVDGSMCCHGVGKASRGVKVDGARCPDSVGKAYRGSKLMGLGAWVQLVRSAGGQS